MIQSYSQKHDDDNDHDDDYADNDDCDNKEDDEEKNNDYDDNDNKDDDSDDNDINKTCHYLRKLGTPYLGPPPLVAAHLIWVEFTYCNH